MTIASIDRTAIIRLENGVILVDLAPKETPIPKLSKFEANPIMMMESQCISRPP